MTGYFLAIIIGFSTSQSGATSIQQTFSTLEKCNAVLNKVVADTNAARARSQTGALVVFASCSPI